jgi:hypothetical protein
MNRIIFLPASSDTEARLSQAAFFDLGVCLENIRPLLPDNDPGNSLVIILRGTHPTSKKTADIVSAAFEISKDPRVRFDETDKPTFSQWYDNLVKFENVKVVLVITQQEHIRSFAEYTAQRLLKNDTLRIPAGIGTDRIIVLDPERNGVVI